MYTLSLLDPKGSANRQVRSVATCDTAVELRDWIVATDYPGFTEGRKTQAILKLNRMAASAAIHSVDGGGWAIRRY